MKARQIHTVTILPLVLAAAFTASAQVNIKGYDNNRSFERQDETALTVVRVRNGMVMSPRIPCIGDARGCEAQPLIDGNVMMLASDANVIRGVVPDGGAAIWQTPQLCMPVRSVPGNDMWGVQTNFGMLSTGVVDPATHNLYQVATCSRDGSGSQGSMQQIMFVLDDRTGNVLARTELDATSNGQRYSTAPRKQRAALGLWNHNGVKFIVICAGSFTESGPNATGWILMFDTYDNQVKAAIATRAGIWMSSNGPAIDADGFIYAGAGNGSFNGTTDLGEAAIKLQFTPPTATTTARLSVVAAWAPFSDASRQCKNAQLTNAPRPTTAVTGMAPSAMVPAALNCDAAWTDQDAHLTNTFFAEFHRYITAGKDGVAYSFDTLNFPRTQPADFANPAANCAKVKMYELGWNLGIAPCPANAAQLNQFPGGATRHIHAPIVQLHTPTATYALVMAENSPLQAWSIVADGSMKYVARGVEQASPDSPINNMQHGGMPGGFCSVSNHAGQDAIAWCSVPDGDANRQVTTGHLYAFDLTRLGEATPSLPTLWKSEEYVYSKFSAPVVNAGVVSLADYAGSVMQWKAR